MHTLDQLFTPEDVDTFIDQEVCRNMPPGFRLEWEAKWPEHITTADRTSVKVDALCRALARRDELRAEIASHMRSSDGILNIRV